MSTNLRLKIYNQNQNMHKVLKTGQILLVQGSPLRQSLTFAQIRQFLNVFQKQDIKFETKKIVPYSREYFFDVIKDVDAYQEFIPWITQSKVLPETVVVSPDKRSGKFEGEVKIGFSSLSFAYISRVSYEQDDWILSEADNSRVFEGLYSHWKLTPMGKDQCEISYNIKMTFANPLYTAVTTQFFDYLANNINKAFEKRCYDKYYKDKPMRTIEQNIGIQEGAESIEISNEQKIGVKQQREQSLKLKNSKYLPDDGWVWGVGQAIQNQGKTISKKKFTSENILKQRELIDSIKALAISGFISNNLDIQLLTKAIEQKEDLYRDLITLHEAFGESNSVYARHVSKLMADYGCVLAK